MTAIYTILVLLSLGFLIAAEYTGYQHRKYFRPINHQAHTRRNRNAKT